MVKHVTDHSTKPAKTKTSHPPAESKPKPGTDHTPPKPKPDEGTPKPKQQDTPGSHKPATKPSRGKPAPSGGRGQGYHADPEQLKSMSTRIETTAVKVDGVAQNVGNVHFGEQSFGVLGTGAAADANNGIAAAHTHVQTAAHSLRAARDRTNEVARHYEQTETSATDALNKKVADIPDTSPTKPSSAGSSHTGGSSPSPKPDSGVHNNVGGHTTTEEIQPQFTRSQMDSRPTSTDQQIKDIARAKGYDPDSHVGKTLKPTENLDHDSRREVVDVRRELTVQPGETMTKVVKSEQADAILRNQTAWVDEKTGESRTITPGTIGGSVARGSDTASYDTPQKLRDKLALDDGGAGWTPVPAGADKAWQIRYPAPDAASSLDISFGGTSHESAADMQNVSGAASPRKWDPPFLGTGYTGGGVPEWIAKSESYEGRAEMYSVHSDGTERLVGVYLKNQGWFDLRGRRPGHVR